MVSEPIIELENKYYIAANSSYADTQIKVLNHIDTFGVFDRWGDILQVGEGIHGLYHEGTRFLSKAEFKINDVRPLLLSSSIKEENVMLSVDLTNDILSFSDKDTLHKILKGSIHIARNKFVKNGACFERINFQNYSSEKVEFTAAFFFEADFRDIFEVRGLTRERRGEIFEIKHITDQILSIKYRGLDNIVRETKIELSHKPDHWENQFTVIYHLSIEPQSSFFLEYSVQCIIDEEKTSVKDFDSAHLLLEEHIHKSRKLFPSIFTSNEQFNHWFNRSQADLLSLLSHTKSGYYPYAGVPWYNTPFGRDGIITALQILWCTPEVAKDVLFFLAKTQAKEHDANADEEPGKIFHEIRGGEMVETKEIPFKEYYGSVDSTPLFLVLAGEYYHRTGDLTTIEKIWPNIEAALNWISKYGDIDGDGFVDYHHKSVNGLINQGWKDSFDSISDEFGNLASPPVALCEVQGYVYDAKLKISHLASLLQKHELAEILHTEAMKLKEHFNKMFWDQELETYVMALDGEKKKCRVKSSNAGHALFSKIVDEAKAASLVNTLMSDELFSGWGIRTLGKNEKRFNPMSYHNGSVWPHDVSLIATGLSRYGFREEANKITAALFDASLFIELQRLPELFCGFERRKGEGPTAYPVACSPQAWSVGAVFLIIQSFLRMEIDGEKKQVVFNEPLLPDFIDNIIISDLSLGKEKASFEIYRYKSGLRINITKRPPDWEILWVQ